MKKDPGLKMLILDIETAPILANVWSLWDQTISLGQIKKDWHVLSWAAKWYGDPASKVMYMDQRGAKDISNDKDILVKLWHLVDEADIIVTQNGNNFDIKKINARFLHHKMPPPSPFKSIDTLVIAKKKFGFTSNKLEYMTENFCKKYKKLKHKKFPGFEMWRECLSGNMQAWAAMEKYNKWDVLSLEELYTVLRPWSNPVNFNLYKDDGIVCSCGSDKFQKRGFFYTAVAKYQRYCCNKCGSWSRGRKNLIDSDRRKDIRVGI